MPVLSTDTAEIEYASFGQGEPVTVFGHGVGASIAETRILGSTVPGTKVYLQFRGHGRSCSKDGRHDYAALAADLRAVADEVHATQALGVSMGAAALLRLLLETPDRFDRVVFFLPAVLDEARDGAVAERLRAQATAIDARDESAVAELLRTELPEPLRDQADCVRYTRQRASALVGKQVSALLRMLAREAPVRDRADLARLGVPALVVVQEGDPLHPDRIGRELAKALPNARLEVFPYEAAVWQERARLRRLLAGFLGG